MDRNDQQAIEGLFDRLADAERRSGPRDREAETFIRERIAEQPGAPYLMAQTIIVQQQALEAAQAELENLQRQVQEQRAVQEQQPAGGGFLSGIFGNSRPPSRSGMVPRVRPGQPLQPGRPEAPFQQAAPQQFPPQQSPWGGRGGGFLAGAAQTAMGVAGGVLLGNAIAGMLGGDTAHATETPAAGSDSTAAADQSADDQRADDPGADDGDIGNDFGDMEF